MAYVASDKISVFPTTRRGSNQIDSRLLTEKSMVGIINQLTSTDGFVITPASDIAETKPFEFNIKGYYFKVDKLSDITNLFNTTTSLSIYATITLDTANGYVELAGQDDDGTYKGVTFSNTKTTASNSYSLLLVSRTSTSTTSWTTPETSRYKYDANAVQFDVDGGII